MDPAPDNIAYLYDGSVEGLFTAVFLTYANKEHRSISALANTINRASGKPHASRDRFLTCPSRSEGWKQARGV